MEYHVLEMQAVLCSTAVLNKASLAEHKMLELHQLPETEGGSANRQSRLRLCTLCMAWQSQAHHQECEVALWQQGIRVHQKYDQGNAKGQQDE